MTEFNMPFAPGNPLYAEELDKLSNHVHDGVVGLKGHADFIHNTELSPSAGQIKSDFYGWYGRVKATARNTGFGVDYTTGKVIIGDTIINVPAGSVFVPPSATSFVAINNVGAVVVYSSLPDESIPLLKVVANGVGITSSEDCRRQSIEVMPRVPEVQTTPVGSVWMFFGNAAPSGWLLMQGQVLSRVTYANLFNHLLTEFPSIELPSNTTFKMPDMRGRAPICLGLGAGLTNRTLGSTAGAETVTLTQSQMPAHGHTMADPGHNHTVIDNGHIHAVYDPGHTHTVADPGHSHFVGQLYDDEGGRSQAGYALSGLDPNNPPADYLGEQRATNAVTGISIIGSGVGVGIYPATADIGLVSSSTGITVTNTGGGGSHTNMQPSFAINFMIKY